MLRLHTVIHELFQYGCDTIRVSLQHRLADFENKQTDWFETTAEIYYLGFRDEKGSEMSSGLDWVRPMINFVDFGLDPECKMLYKFMISSGFELS